MPCNSIGGGGSAPMAAPPTTPAPITFSQMSMSDLDAMYDAQHLTPAQQKSCDKYVQSATEPGTLYSLSQNMNYALVNDLPMSPAQAKTDQNLSAAMHDIGGNYTLTRYDHQGQVDAILKQNGLSGGYQNYTIDQLRNALIGTEFHEKKYLSSSIDDFAQSPQSSKKVFQTRAVKITYQTSSGAQCVVPGTGAGGNLGEVILGKNQKQKIVGVNLTGKKARAKGTQSYDRDQIELVIQIGD